MTKQLKDLNLEELLQELENGSSEMQFRTDGVEGDVLPFFNKFEIVPGDDEIASIILFKIYQAWSKKPVSVRKFVHAMRLVLNVSKGKVHINEDQFKLKREDWVHFYQNPVKQKATEQVRKRHFDAFLKHFKLDKGEEPIHFESLVLLYTRFINEIKRKQRNLTRQTLEEYLKLYFKEKVTTYGSYYYVSDTVWNSLSRETYNEKEKIKKKRKKISIPHS